MNDITFTALRLLTMILMAILSAYVIPWIKGKIGNERLDQIAKWAAWAVNWAEQVVTAPGSGAERKQIVINFLRELLTSKNLTLTDEQIEILIESAVRQMHLNENDVIELPVSVPNNHYYDPDSGIYYTSDAGTVPLAATGKDAVTDRIREASQTIDPDICAGAN